MRLDPSVFTHVDPSIVRSARLHRSRIGWHSAITIGDFIFSKRPDDDKLTAHELVHVEQFHELGIPRFVFRYAKEYVWNVLGGYPLRDACRRISLEGEARVGAELWERSQL